MPATPMTATDYEHQIARLQVALRRYVAQKSPASRLPVELWDAIFQECIPDPPEPSLVQAPMNVSQVCRRWRSIVLSNPALWSALAVTTTRRHTEHSSALEALHRIIQLWLLRSDARPLSVSLAQSETVKSASPISWLLDAVLAHAARLRSLHVCAPETCLFPLELPELYLPVLEDLKIESPWLRLAAPNLAIPLDRAPRLQSLAVLRSSVDAAHIQSFDYTQLTKLTLLPDALAPAHLFWSTDEALTFLADAHQLHTLRLAFNDFMPRRRTLVHSPSLLSLSLEFRDALAGAARRHARIGALFSLLYTPNLQHLALRDRGAQPPHPIFWPAIQSQSQFLDTWPQDQFLAYLSAAVHLRSLHLEHLPLYETQVIGCLQCVPRVAELVLAHRGSQRNVGDLLLSALTQTQGTLNGGTASEPIAKALRSVEFRNCGKRCTEQALISMVDSRAGALQYLRVHRSALPSPELTERVANWNMVVDVHY